MLTKPLGCGFRASSTAGLWPALMPPRIGPAILPEKVPTKPDGGSQVIKVKERAAFGLGRSEARPAEVRGLVKRYGRDVAP